MGHFGDGGWPCACGSSLCLPTLTFGVTLCASHTSRPRRACVRCPRSPRSPSCNTTHPQTTHQAPRRSGQAVAAPGRAPAVRATAHPHSPHERAPYDRMQRAQHHTHTRDFSPRRTGHQRQVILLSALRPVSSQPPSHGARGACPPRQHFPRTPYDSHALPELTFSCAVRAQAAATSH